MPESTSRILYKMVPFSMCILLILALSLSAQAKSSPKPIFEVYDIYKEAKLVLTDNSLYIEFTRRIRDKTNEELDKEYLRDLDSFNDSNGQFIPGEKKILTTNKVSYSLDEIDDISFHKGKIIFSYSNKHNLGFEDLISSRGNKALDNFYVEDLEYLTRIYQKLIKS